MMTRGVSNQARQRQVVLCDQGAGLILQHLQMIEQIAQNHNLPVEGKTKQVSCMQ
jgi:hypothetical protein